MSVRLSEVDGADANETADQLRVTLSEWLTAPIPFDEALRERVMLLGDPQTVEARWGQEIASAFEAALVTTVVIQTIDNPMRIQLFETIERLRAEKQSWRIYCHRKARQHFESIFRENALAPECFLHSVRDYAATSTFDVLIKIGPLRSRGWGSVPDALLSAPRFNRLVQIVWSGCVDESDFGYDPVVVPMMGVANELSFSTFGDSISWNRESIRIGWGEDSNAEDLADIDELQFFQELAHIRALRRATLVEIDEDHGILYPPHSQVPSFDPGILDELALGYRVPGETLSDGMFIVSAFLADADLGELHAEDGYYSRIWKKRLRDEWTRDSADLLRRLSDAGIGLRPLAPRVRDWCRAPSTVIHAPQQSKHLETIVEVLGINQEFEQTSDIPRFRWWERAWDEIVRSRGEAIQTGRQEHEIVNEELLAALRDLLPEIRHRSETGAGFQIEIPIGKSLSGSVRFHFARSVQEGFLAPESALRTVLDLDSLEQWRG